MKYAIAFLFLALSLMLAVQLQAQPVRKIGYVWDKQRRTYAKAGVIAVADNANKEKNVTALSRIWVLPSKTKPGYWRGVKAGEIDARNRLNASYLYQIANMPYNSYPQQATNAKVINLNNLNEEVKLLAKPEITNEGLLGVNGRMNVHYMNKLKVGLISLTRQQDHIIVVDSLYVPSARKLSNAFLCIDQSGKPYLKVVANTIVYESPVMLSLMGNEPADFIFSSENMYFKSIYEGLEKYELQPPPPFIMVGEGLNNNVYHNYNGDIEKILLNRLFIKLMEQCFNTLSVTGDDWIRDKLVERFQQYRFRKLKPELLGNDIRYQNMMTSVVSNFDESFKDFQVKKLRDIDGTKIVVDGDIGQIPLKPLKYYALPTVASLKPLIRDSALGSILYTGTGDADIKVSIETELGYDTPQFSAAAAKLAGKGITLEKKLPQNIMIIDEQPLKINGKTIGRIIPVSNQIIRLDMDLVEGAKTIAELFPRFGRLVFNVDLKISRDQPPFSQPVSLLVDSALLQKLDYAQPLKSFNVIERAALTGNVKVSSNISAARTDEGTLNYIEIIMDFKFADKSVLYGPFRLSAYNTIASEMNIPFLKYSEEYSITVSGRAVYDNGEINVKPFETKTGVIVLDDAMLNTP
ncbi:MAG: hypothetical protein ABI687_06055 [Flavitalea sp.]